MKPQKLKSLIILLVLILFSASAMAGPLDGLVITGRMKQIIGTFETYGQVKVGDSFELNLTNLPNDEKKIVLVPSPSDSMADGQSKRNSYIPFSAPLVVEKVDVGGGPIGRGLIRLSSKDSSATLIISILAVELKKNCQATIRFYEESDGGIICMAEADGFIK